MRPVKANKKKQIRIKPKRLIISLLVIFGLLVVGNWVYSGLVHKKDPTATSGVRAAEHAATGGPSPAASPAGGPVDSPAGGPANGLGSNIKAWVLSVNGQPVVGLADQATAESVIKEIKDGYIQKLNEEGPSILEQINFNEKVEVAERDWPSDLIRNKEEAKRILLRGTDKLVYHTVQRGDSLWSIAEARNMKVEDLQKANPDVNPDAMQPGQQINMVVADPYVNLRAREKYTKTENIAFETTEVRDPDIYPWESYYQVRGVYGKKEVTYVLDRENLNVIDRKVIDEKVLSNPKNAIYRRGTKTAPKLGSGKFQLPINGELTSSFGWRGWEFHNGIDLAAPWGVPVRAADAGTVVRAEWYSGYGQLIVIDHGGGEFSTWYGHLSSFAVKVGDAVSKGQVIGYNGSTGRSTGPHVHFEIRYQGRPVNPLNYFPR